MQQNDMNSSPYYQYYQPHFQNPYPNPSPNPNPPQSDPQFNPPLSAPGASAPPFSSDFPNYSSNYPQFPQNPDPFPSTYPPNPISQSPSPSLNQPYSFPHLEPQPANYYPSNQNQSQSTSNYDYPGLNYNPPFSSGAYGASSAPAPNYESSFDNSVNYGAYGDQGMYDGGVYKYNGGKTESFGSKGGRSQSSGGGDVLFDDYGRPINVSSGKNGKGSVGNSARIVKAVPKVEEKEDVKSGALKFRVKLLSEGFGQTDMDVLCQIGLDGIRVLDPATSRTLKIYSLDTVARWEVLDSYIFAFWAKTSVDIEPRRVRLKSNSYTTSNILDAVTAASIQFKEMGETNRTPDVVRGSDQSLEKKKGFADWMKLVKPPNEEKDHWVPDEAVTKCTACGTDFNAFIRRHHCRNCGDIFCDKCTQGRIALTADEDAQPVRVCDRCMAEVTQRLSHAKDAAVKVTGIQSHEDLARKLKAEMEKNRKVSSGRSSDSSSIRMREVECPTCTVHLQVQVPSSGSETIECSVCQHPFLVSAY